MALMRLSEEATDVPKLHLIPAVNSGRKEQC